MHYRPRLRRILIETEWFFDYDTTQAHVEWDRSEVDRGGRWCDGGALTVRENVANIMKCHQLSILPIIDGSDGDGGTVNSCCHKQQRDEGAMNGINYK